MKKLTIAGALALGLVLTFQQEASAWMKWGINFGIGLNYEGGNNNWFWGLVRSGQAPGYPTDVYIGRWASPVWGYPVYPGHDYSGCVASIPDYHVSQEPPATTAQAIYYSNSGYQPAAYNYASAGYYQYPAYNYTSYGYGQVPSYWYGK